MSYQITVTYDEEKLRAAFDCPLCGEHWEFPFPTQRVFDKPCPNPAQIVTLHLYGTGSKVLYCHEFDPFEYIPIVESLDEARATLDLELVASRQKSVTPE
jgi:hypothetical protein